MPLGGLRLIDTTGNQLDKALDIIDAAVSGVPWLKKAQGRAFYAVGGTWRALAKLHMEIERLSAARDARLFARAARGDRLLRADPTREEALGVEGHRRRGPPAARGAAVRSPGAGAAAPKQPAADLRPLLGVRHPRGAALRAAVGVRAARDPLLSFCDDYAATALALARARPRAVRLDRCAVHEPWGRTRRRRSGGCATPPACCRTLAGARIPTIAASRASTSSRTPPSAASIIPGRMFLALAVYFRHVGRRRRQRALRAAERPRLQAAQKRARIIGAAIRAAHMLSIGMPGIIDETPLSYRGQTPGAVPAEGYAALDGERLRRRFSALAALVEQDGRHQTAPLAFVIPTPWGPRRQQAGHVSAVE